MSKKIIGVLLLAAALSFSGCGNASTNSSTAPSSTPASSTPTAEASSISETERITIKVAGSTSVGPLMKELKEAYGTTGSTAVVEIQETGSSAGITATIEGAADVGMSSRDLKDEEKAQGLDEIVIALDGIAIIVHNDNPVSELTQDQISAIYKGEISNWNEVGGDDGAIIVFSREEGSGTRGAFEELLKLEESVDGGTRSLVTDDALFENSTGAVKTNVAGSKNAIGYISLGSMDENVKAIGVDGVACSVDNVKNGSYSIARPFLICTLGTPDTGVQAFIDYILSADGQAVVVDNNYISII